MALRLRFFPDPCLRLIAEPIVPSEMTFLESVSFREFLGELRDLMHEKGGVGIAAPQVGVSSRVICVDTKSVDPENGEALFLINPEVLEATTDLTENIEGCLSVPDKRFRIFRPTTVRVKYLDNAAQPQEREFTGLLSAIVQHEIDHLNGILFFDPDPNDR